MSDTTESFEGTLHGLSIKLDRVPNLPEGSKVSVVVRKAKLTPIERTANLQRLFGGCSDDAASLNEYLQQNREQRRINRRGVDS